MNITIISVGKIREKYLKLGIAEFEKRLKSYCKLTFYEVPDEQAPETLSNQELLEIIHKEGERILRKIKPHHYIIALDIKGEDLSSVQLAQKLEHLSIQGKSSITFIIGGSNGLSDQVLQRANSKLSFSKMTFPHQLMKLILLEQIYRSFRIIRGEPYHK